MLDDMPLVAFEKEVFAECGSWKNFIELEESLTLEELFELYDITMKRQNRLSMTIAAAFGAEVDVSELYDDVNDHIEEKRSIPMSSYDPLKGGELKPIETEKDLAGLPIKLGYSTIKKEE